MLLTEIESVNSKFADIKSVLNNLTGQCTSRMGEAQNLIGEARKTVDTAKSDENTIKKAEAPKAEFSPSKAPKAALSDLPSAKTGDKKSDPFANVGGFNKDNNKNNNNNNFNNNNNNNKPAQAPAQNQQQNKPAQGNKSASFNFDMAELLKAAEEEAAKDPEN